MTREEAIRELKIFSGTTKTRLSANFWKALEMAIEALKQEPKSEWQQDHEILRAYSDGAENVLDKIRTEIKSMGGDVETLSDVLDVIDKYGAESEE